MTDGAIAEPSGPDIVKCRWLSSRYAYAHAVAFQAQLRNLGSTQHSGINGAMRLVAGLTSIQLEGSMLKDKRALLIGVAGKAAFFGPNCQATKGTSIFRVGIVAIAAHQGTLQHRVVKGPLELGPRRRVATGTQVLLLGFQQSKVRCRRMHLVAGHTRDVASPVG